MFYNKQGVGDVLIIQLTTESPEEVAVDRQQDVAILSDAKTGSTVGYNVFNASTYVKTDAVGQVELTEELVASIQSAFQKSGVDDVLDVDFSPKFVIGHVVSKEKHPNADKLSVCQVDVGTETVQIVCGAPNVDAGQKVVVAKVGAVMPSGLVIKDAELRGVASSGMICSAKELELPNAPEARGILVLEEEATVGEAFTNSK